ncbi:hypothetical protein A3Q56_03228 [Intoshia linei]|uniref:Uncharacterized protein n=1 Tax=Intoshia linei TaxID=1819745 RepID=A0A177B480_9BILA|nr:hypothetical protein A3Q56_03228 [Intoshia linei]
MMQDMYELNMIMFLKKGYGILALFGTNESRKHLFIITLGFVSVYNIKILDSLLYKYRSSSISVSLLMVECKKRYVPELNFYNELCEYIAFYTRGIFSYSNKKIDVKNIFEWQIIHNRYIHVYQRFSTLLLLRADEILKIF